MKQNNRMAQSIIALALALLVAPRVLATNQWELKNNSNGISIYTRSTPGSGIKELKATFEVKASLNEVKALLLDVSQQKDWVYSTKKSAVLKNIAPEELIYYSEKNMPWPVSNRDVVMHVRITAGQGNEMFTLDASSASGIVPLKAGIVRAPVSEVKWKVTAVDDKTASIEYWAKADPGGSIPAWVTNMFLTKGAHETFVKFRERLATNAGAVAVANKR